MPACSMLTGLYYFRRDGNAFIRNRCNYYKSDIFEWRLPFKKTFCITGPEAARTFYTKGKITRVGAMPKSSLRLLQDNGSVATLDDAEHLHRKAMFMGLMTPQNIQRLVGITARIWIQEFSAEEHSSTIDFFSKVESILFASACKWAGVALLDGDRHSKVKQVSAMIDGAGSIGPRNWKGTILRWQTEKWLEDTVRHYRSRADYATSDAALHVFSLHKDMHGNLLDEKIVAIELLNIIRPTVAIARFALFAAMAMHQYPECREKLARNDLVYHHYFVQEVRRFYPFFPFLGGIVREPFVWNRQEFAPGTRILLDIYGTNRDERTWVEPEKFFPERFIAWNHDAYNFLPQGGGDFFVDHRCAGEQLTIQLLEKMVFLIANAMKYEVIERDYTLNMKRIPALPREIFLIRNISVTNPG